MTQERTHLVESSLISRSRERNVARVALLSCAFLLFCVGVAFIFRAATSGNNDRPNTENKKGLASSVAAASAESSTTLPAVVAQGAPVQRGPIEVVRFSLYDVGIYPNEARVGKGLVAITIEDLSGGSTGLIVEQEKGQSKVLVGSVQRLQHWRARNEMRLEPGRYEVYMADRPTNRAVLIVEP